MWRFKTGGLSKWDLLHTPDVNTPLYVFQVKITCNLRPVVYWKSENLRTAVTHNAQCCARYTVVVYQFLFWEKVQKK